MTICSVPKQLLLVSNKEFNLINNNTINVYYINDIDLELFKIIIKCQKNYRNFDNYYNPIKIETNEIVPIIFPQVETFDEDEQPHNHIIQLNQLSSNTNGNTNDNTNGNSTELNLFVYFNTTTHPLLDELVDQKSFSLISYDSKFKVKGTEFTKEKSSDGETKATGTENTSTSYTDLDEELLKFYIYHIQKRKFKQ